MTTLRMRAVQYLGQSGVAIQEVPAPGVGPGQVLVHPTFTGICGSDVHVSHGLHPRVRPPVILGHEFAGRVVASGSDQWRPGQRVAVEPLRSCGSCDQCAGPHYNRCQQLQILGIDADGSLAELVSVPAERLLELPDSVPDRLGALVEPIAVAAHAVRALGDLADDQPVLVFGGGPIGWLAAAILKTRGHQVHLAETNTFRQAMIRDAGHTVADIDSQDFLMTPFQAGLEASGTGIGLRTLVDAVAPGGTVSVVGLPKGPNELDAMRVISKELTIRGSRVYTHSDFVDALRLLEQAGPSFEALITHDIDLDDVITDGLSRIEAGGPVGKVVVRGTA